MTDQITVAAVVTALGLPPEARVDQRVPKKLLVEQGAPTASDKRQIQDGIEELLWIAALKPTNIGVPAFRGKDGDVEREYLEIAVLTTNLRAKARAARLMELIHRAIPYPLLLIAESDAAVVLSLAHKRQAQNEAGKVVIEDLRKTELRVVDKAGGEQAPVRAAFLATLVLSSLPSRDLFALYQGWIDRVMALEASRITGTYAPPGSEARSAAVRDGLDAHARLTREVALLRTQAEKEKQMNRRVDLNLQIKQLEAELASHADKLRTHAD